MPRYTADSEIHWVLCWPHWTQSIWSHRCPRGVHAPLDTRSGCTCQLHTQEYTRVMHGHQSASWNTAPCGRRCYAAICVCQRGTTFRPLTSEVLLCG